MNTKLTGTFDGQEATAISSLAFSAESAQDELTLKIVLDFYNGLKGSDLARIDSLPEWTDVNESAAGWFYEILMRIDGPLTDEEISRASGCLGYALREVLAGEDLSEPEIVRGASRYLLKFDYDSTKTRRDDPDFLTAFEKAEQYIREGTPIRTTNRAGAGTKGTRLVEGIGERGARFFVR